MLDDPRYLALQADPDRLAQAFDLLSQILPIKELVRARARGRSKRRSLVLGPRHRVRFVKGLQIWHQQLPSTSPYTRTWHLTSCSERRRHPSSHVCKSLPSDLGPTTRG